MIFSHDLKYVFVSIPRTASSSIRIWLKNRHRGKQTGKDHDWVVSKSCRKYLIFVVVRDPYARCYSFWRWNTLKGGYDISLKEYLSVLIEYGKRSLNAYMTQSEYVRLVKPTVVLRFEELNSGLISLPFVRNLNGLKHLRQTNENVDQQDNSFKECYSLKERDLLQQYCQEDFNLGYDQ